MNTNPLCVRASSAGIRVLDFTWKTVGPWAPRLLTHYGAEVIHVERAGGWDDHRYNATPSIVSDEPQAAQLPGTKKVYADPQFNTLREEPPAAAQVPGEKKLYAAPYFNTLHNGKLAISLNTKHPGGPEDRRAAHRHLRCAGRELQRRGAAELGAYVGAHPRAQPAARVHELLGLRAHGRVEGLSQLRAHRRRHSPAYRSRQGFPASRPRAGVSPISTSWAAGWAASR